MELSRAEDEDCRVIPAASECQVQEKKSAHCLAPEIIEISTIMAQRIFQISECISIPLWLELILRQIERFVSSFPNYDWNVGSIFQIQIGREWFDKCVELL